MRINAVIYRIGHKQQKANKVTFFRRHFVNVFYTQAIFLLTTALMRILFLWTFSYLILQNKTQVVAAAQVCSEESASIFSRTVAKVAPWSKVAPLYDI